MRHGPYAPRTDRIDNRCSFAPLLRRFGSVDRFDLFGCLEPVAGKTTHEELTANDDKRPFPEGLIGAERHLHEGYCCSWVTVFGFAHRCSSSSVCTSKTPSQSGWRVLNQARIASRSEGRQIQTRSSCSGSLARAEGVSGPQRLEVMGDRAGDKEIDGHLAFLRSLLEFCVQFRRQTDGRRHPGSWSCCHGHEARQKGARKWWMVRAVSSTSAHARRSC